VEEAAFEKTMGVNVRGVFLGTKYASKQMVSQEPGANGDRGWIVNLASVYGLGGGVGIGKLPSSSMNVMREIGRIQC
jgi:NAD(P)-dependent dehydrogenase (short-subunit alcohol dehydrogenase family)